MADMATTANRVAGDVYIRVGGTRVSGPASGCDIQYHGKSEIGTTVVASRNNRYQPLGRGLRLAVKLCPFPVFPIAGFRDWHGNQAMQDCTREKQFLNGTRIETLNVSSVLIEGG